MRRRRGEYKKVTQNAVNKLHGKLQPLGYRLGGREELTLNPDDGVSRTVVFQAATGRIVPGSEELIEEFKMSYEDPGYYPRRTPAEIADWCRVSLAENESG